MGILQFTGVYCVRSGAAAACGRGHKGANSILESLKFTQARMIVWGIGTVPEVEYEGRERECGADICMRGGPRTRKADDPT